jgi:hypothetical protein
VVININSFEPNSITWIPKWQRLTKYITNVIKSHSSRAVFERTTTVSGVIIISIIFIHISTRFFLAVTRVSWQAHTILVNFSACYNHVNGIMTAGKPTNLPVFNWTTNSVKHLYLLGGGGGRAINILRRRQMEKQRPLISGEIMWPALFITCLWNDVNTAANAQTLPSETVLWLLKFRESNYAASFN